MAEKTGSHSLGEMKVLCFGTQRTRFLAAQSGIVKLKAYFQISTLPDNKKTHMVPLAGLITA